MADENFKESFNVFQLLGFVVVFVTLLCLPPIVTWSRILGSAIDGMNKNRLSAVFLSVC